MRKMYFPVWALIAFIIFAGLVGITHSGQVSANNNRPMPVNAMPGGRNTQLPLQSAVGIPAIQPKTTTTDPATPTFTEADVDAYVTSHLVPTTLDGSSLPTVVQVSFIMSQNASALLGGESTDLPDNTLVCYVQLSGTFIFAGPNGASGGTFQKGYELFDAHTGNLLMVGGLS